jgi:hypothetical protein
MINESLIIYHMRDMTIIKVFLSRSNSKVMVRRSKIKVPIEKSCHKETHMKYESPILLSIQKVWPM